MASIKSLSKFLDNTLKSDDLENVNVDLLEVLSDSTMPEGILKEIPIIGTLVGIARTASSIQDMLFIKEIATFLTNLKEIPVNKRTSMIDNIENSRKYKIKIGEKLLYILDRCEDHEKAEILSILFAAFINEEITYDEFLKASKVIESTIIEDLKWFVNHDWIELSIEEAAEYISWGLFEIIQPSIKIKRVRYMNQEDDDNDDLKYKIEGGEISTQITTIGQTIREILKSKI